MLSDHGIVEAIEGRAARFPLGVTIECDPQMRAARFGEAVEGAAYFFVCEGFANALKHARAERVRVRLSRAAGALEVEVSDDGGGFDVGATARSGLAGLADRIEALGGRLEVDSAERPRDDAHRAAAARRGRPLSEPSAARLRVVIADDHFLVREGVRMLLEDSGEVEVLDAVGTATELRARVAELEPDAVMTDIRMPPEPPDGGHRRRAPDPRRAPAAPASSSSPSTPTSPTPSSC